MSAVPTATGNAQIRHYPSRRGNFGASLSAPQLSGASVARSAGAVNLAMHESVAEVGAPEGVATGVREH